MFLGGQPRRCICTDASYRLSAIAELLVTNEDKSLVKLLSQNRGHSAKS